MIFKKLSDTQVKVQTADGTWYELNKRTDIPLTRWLAAKPYQIQDELKITFAGLNLFIEKFNTLAKSDKLTKAEIQTELANLTSLLTQKIMMAEDIITIRLQLASVFWLFKDEDPDVLDVNVMAKKVEVMKANDAAFRFFLRSPLPEGILQTTFTPDTLLFLVQMKQIQAALQDTSNLPPAL